MGQQYGCIKVFRPSFKKKKQKKKKNRFYIVAAVILPPHVFLNVSHRLLHCSHYIQSWNNMWATVCGCLVFDSLPGIFFFFLIPNFCVTLIPLLFRSTAYM